MPPGPGRCDGPPGGGGRRRAGDVLPGVRDDLPLGVTLVVCSAVDSRGNPSARRGFTVTVVDTTPPTMTVPCCHHRLETTGPTGAAVSYLAVPTKCTRPAELDCSFETICESCGFFATIVEFRPTLERQAEHAAARGQTARAGLYRRLVASVEGEAS